MSNLPAITLLSDLGTRDASVTVAKAILMHHAPNAAFVDISHQVAQYDLQQAAYLLLSAYKHFPKRSIHLLLIDVFAGNVPRILLGEKDGHFFIAPDNGLLPLAFGLDLENTRLCFEISKPHLFSEWISNAGAIIESIQNGGERKVRKCFDNFDHDEVYENIVQNMDSQLLAELECMPDSEAFSPKSAQNFESDVLSPILTNPYSIEDMLDCGKLSHRN